MKATGIIRRMDDLGRVVIPKEIRETLNIEYGEALEIFTDEDCIIFKKYYTTPIKDEIEYLKKHKRS
jgi:transcriptional pleiotropic regulator of transition state genes